MKIDIHRHAGDIGTADRVLQNLFHHQAGEVIPGRWYSIGLHPWNVEEQTLEGDIEMVRKGASNNQILAVGEAGLDKAIKTPLEIQKQAFEYQISIAVEMNKPMIIHCVRAYQEIMEYRISLHHKYPWIIHWFNASREMGEQLIDKGFYLSFGHMLFNNNSKAFHAFTDLPLERIFLETDDAGYSIDEVYDRASQLRLMELSELEAQIESNFYNCFGILP